jgi:hypothetical protein
MAEKTIMTMSNRGGLTPDNIACVDAMVKVNQRVHKKLISKELDI